MLFPPFDPRFTSSSNIKTPLPKSTKRNISPILQTLRSKYTILHLFSSLPFFIFIYIYHLLLPYSFVLLPSDKISHLYTLVVHPDNRFEIYIDQQVVREGSLLSDFNPPVNPPKEIDDPEDIKPTDWVDEAK